MSLGNSQSKKHAVFLKTSEHLHGYFRCEDKIGAMSGTIILVRKETVIDTTLLNT
jgi:hypothetical protein